MTAASKEGIQPEVQAIIKHELGEAFAEAREALLEDAKKAAMDAAQGIGERDIVPERFAPPVSRGPSHVRIGEERGDAFLGFVGCLAHAGGDIVRAQNVAKQRDMPKLVQRALGETTLGGGGILVPPVLQTEVIEFLRESSTVRQAGPRVVPLVNGTADFGRVATGTSGSWQGENEAYTYSEQSFDDVKLVERKVTVKTAISKELMAHAGPDMAAVIRDDFAAEIEEEEGAKFLRGTGASYEPKGLENLAISGNKFNANVTVNFKNVTLDLVKGERLIRDQKIRGTPAQLARFVSPRTMYFLMGLLGDYGQPVFPETRQGKILMSPAFMTTALPDNLGGGSDESKVIAAMMPQILLGQGMTTIQFSDVAAYNDGSSLVSAFDLDQIVAKMSNCVDLQDRHGGKSISVIEAVDWGA